MKTYYDLLDPNDIFGSVGRCGGGYNTVWEDWSEKGIKSRENIMREFEEGMNQICGHYDRLEKSILEEGFRNPIIITRGLPRRRKMKHIPFYIRRKYIGDWLLMEGNSGGSRLHIAQKHGIKIPCFVNDYVGNYSGEFSVESLSQIKCLYKDFPKKIFFSPRSGLIESYDSKKTHYHLDGQITDESLVGERGKLWRKIMKKYGYECKAFYAL